MIPLHTQSGVLPPFYPGTLPSDPGAMAPYQVQLSEFLIRFGTTIQRINLLKRFIKYRTDLQSKGISEGFQWVDGSFVEQVEITQSRSPKDIDVVTFFFRPDGLTDMDSWEKFVQENSKIFDANTLREEYSTDGYYVDLYIHPAYLVHQIQYWFGLFSHQRETYLWKGLVQIPLEDDVDGSVLLTELEAKCLSD